MDKKLLQKVYSGCTINVLFYKWFMAGYVVCCLLLYGSCIYLVVYTISVLEIPLLLLAVSCLNNDTGAPQ